MKYWSGKGQYQDLYEKYWKELVPDMGEADTTEGEALRAIARINHDIYNNGGGNIVEVDAVYDDDGDHYADEYSISSFYDDFFDKVPRCSWTERRPQWVSQRAIRSPNLTSLL